MQNDRVHKKNLSASTRTHKVLVKESCDTLQSELALCCYTSNMLKVTRGTDSPLKSVSYTLASSFSFSLLIMTSKHKYVTEFVTWMKLYKVDSVVCFSAKLLSLCMHLQTSTAEKYRASNPPSEYWYSPLCEGCICTKSLHSHCNRISSTTVCCIVYSYFVTTSACFWQPQNCDKMF